MRTTFSPPSTLAAFALGGALLLIGCGGDVTDTADLDGGNEVPAVTTAASGEATARLTGNQLTVTGSFTGLESDLTEVAGSSAHVHRAPEGENGPVVFNLAVTSSDQRSGTFTATQTLTDTQRDDFIDGLHYVNIHTVGNPDGELRGQLNP